MALAVGYIDPRPTELVRAMRKQVRPSRALWALAQDVLPGMQCMHSSMMKCAAFAALHAICQHA